MQAQALFDEPDPADDERTGFPDERRKMPDLKVDTAVE
jgi:hypothetical protein